MRGLKYVCFNNAQLKSNDSQINMYAIYTNNNQFNETKGREITKRFIVARSNVTYVHSQDLFGNLVSSQPSGYF